MIPYSVVIKLYIYSIVRRMQTKSLFKELFTILPNVQFYWV